MAEGTSTIEAAVWATAAMWSATAPPNPYRCQRCGKPRMYRPADEPCCNWRGRYRGRHRRVR